MVKTTTHLAASLLFLVSMQSFAQCSDQGYAVSHHQIRSAWETPQQINVTNKVTCFPDTLYTMQHRLQGDRRVAAVQCSVVRASAGKSFILRYTGTNTDLHPRNSDSWAYDADDGTARCHFTCIDAP